MAEKSIRIIRRREVQNITGLSRSTIYARLKTDVDFPKPIRLGRTAVGWIADEVEQYIKRLINQSRPQTP